MGIKIRNITAKNCGPVGAFNQEFSNLNLIYSRNEGGKSFLVEFIIRCLFKNKKPWGELRETGTGRVTVTGLDNKQVDFKPDKGAKLENYLEEDARGLPLSLLNLLVVKEGETGIAGSKEGIDKETIKDLLSSRHILDALDSKISETVKKAKIDDEIEIDKKGIGKNYYDKLAQLGRINEIISRLNIDSGQWMIKDLKLKIEKLRGEKETLLRARRYKAFKLSGEIERLEETLEKTPEEIILKLDEQIKKYEKHKTAFETLKKEIDDISKQLERIPELEKRKALLLKARKYKAFQIAENIRLIKEELNAFPEDEIHRIENTISKYSDKKNELESRNKSAKEAGEKSAQYEWLKSARENYNKFLLTSETHKKLPVFLIPVAATLFTTGMVLVLFDQKAFGISALLIGTILALFFYIRHVKVISVIKFSREMAEISGEFKERFGEELKNITQLETLLYEQEKYHHKLDLQQDEIIRVQTELESIKESVKDGLRKLTSDRVLEEKEWNSFISEIKQKRKSKSDELQRLREQLAVFETDEMEFERKDPGVTFDKTEFEEVKNELNRLKELEKQVNSKKYELGESEKFINETRDEICTLFKKLTGKEIFENEWSTRLDEIIRHRNGLKQQFENIKGELKGLGISTPEYLNEDPGIEFRQAELDKTDRDIQLADNELEEAEKKLAGLKAELISVTEADAGTDWNDLIGRLYNKKSEVVQELEAIKAEIIAGKLLYETIFELQQEEDVKLTEALNSREVSSLLYQLTARYKRLSFYNSEIIISDDYSDFNLKDLSTGAREQVMIALRIGFLKRILKNDTAFLILDDAFQHSDYEKRMILVKTIHELSRNGWQIIYFTMDDHIKNLFRKQKTTDYKEIDLANVAIF